MASGDTQFLLLNRFVKVPFNRSTGEFVQYIYSKYRLFYLELIAPSMVFPVHVWFLVFFYTVTAKKYTFHFWPTLTLKMLLYTSAEDAENYIV